VASPRHLVWLLLRDPSHLDEQEQRTLRLLRQEQRADELTQRYMKIVRERDGEAFDPWLEQCVTCGLPALETFAQGLQKDYSAVKAALTLPYRNGPVEGQINRLKFVKRSMYGRGSFALLRQRVLKAS
jgi:transposase